jgi:hypothetical protein
VLQLAARPAESWCHKALDLKRFYMHAKHDEKKKNEKENKAAEQVGHCPLK